ncbi:MAG: Sec-independent protein translocase protein TatB [Xanthobacteraceae bacterium]
MFDISWTEFLLIGVVALVFIGPKELPGVMRTLGQYTRKIRGMAADFQNQFQEAMREAEVADLKKQVDDMAHDIKSYDPLKSAREDVENIGKELNKDLDKDFAKKPLELMTSTEQKAPADPAATSAEASSPAAPSITESSVTESSASEVAAAEPAAPPLPAPELKPEPAAIATPESTERTG